MLDQYQNIYLISLVFSLPVSRIVFGYYEEKLHVDHFWEFISLNCLELSFDTREDSDVVSELT